MAGLVVFDPVTLELIKGDAPSAPDDLFLLFPMRVTHSVDHV